MAPIRGENLLRGFRTTSKLPASTPLSISAMTTSLAEAIRGRAFDSLDLPYHDHAHEGSRIDRSVIATMDSSCRLAAISFTPPTINDFYGMEADGRTGNLASWTAARPLGASGPSTLGYCITGLGSTELAISGSRPAVKGKALVSCTGTGNAKFRLFCRESESYCDTATFSGGTLQWIDIPALEVIRGLLNIEVHVHIDTALLNVEIWNIVLSETRTDTQIESDGSHNLGSDPRP